MSPARFEPPDGWVLHGAGQDPEGFAEYVAALPAELAPALAMSYLATHPQWTAFRQWRGFTRAELREQMARYGPCAQQVALSMCVPDGRTGGRPDPYEHRVAAGHYDDELSDLADLCAAHTAPVFVRPGFEFNGHWNRYDPAAYAVAFRRIVRVFRDRGADNCAFVWHAVTAPPGEPNWRDWYPGPDAVDWWGLSLFLPDQWACPSCAEFLAAAEAEGKPVMICESAPMRHSLSTAAATWKEWFEPYFRFVRETPAVKAFCYINMNFPTFPEWTEWGDCRLHTSAEILRRYVQELRRPCYLHRGWWDAPCR